MKIEVKKKIPNIVRSSFCLICTGLTFVPLIPAKYITPTIKVSETGEQVPANYTQVEFHSVFRNVMGSNLPGFTVYFFIALSMYAACATFYILDIFFPHHWMKKAGDIFFFISLIGSLTLIILGILLSGAA